MVQSLNYNNDYHIQMSMAMEREVVLEEKAPQGDEKAARRRPRRTVGVSGDALTAKPAPQAKRGAHAPRRSTSARRKARARARKKSLWRETRSALMMREARDKRRAGRRAYGAVCVVCGTWRGGGGCETRADGESGTWRVLVRSEVSWRVRRGVTWWDEW